MSSADGNRPPAQPQTAPETNPTPSPSAPGLPPPTPSPEGECTKVPTSSSSASEINMDIAYLTPGQRLHDFSDSDSMGTTDDEGFILQLSKKAKKRRHGAQSTSSSSSTIISIENKSPALTVIYMPIDQTKIITKLNELKLTELLESHAPASVIQIRPNYRLNLLSVDTRNMAASSSLLKVSSLLGIPVRAFEPRSPAQATGVIKGIDATIKIDSKDTIAQLRSSDNTPVISARRLGTSASVAITFASPRLPDFIFLGLVRHKVELFVEKPIQCHRCSRFGHIASTCQHAPTCSRCSGPHQRTQCNDNETPTRCCNCGKNHEASSHQCVTWKDELEIRRIRQVNNLDYRTARSSVTNATNFPALEQSIPQENLTASRSTTTGTSSTTQKADSTQIMDSKTSQREHQREEALPQNQTSVKTPDQSKTPEQHFSQRQERTRPSYSQILTTKGCNEQHPLRVDQPSDRSQPSSGVWLAIPLAAEKHIRDFLAQFSSPVARLGQQAFEFLFPLLVALFK
ncbi:unnamed protein product [Ixodes pacificus]